MSTVARRPQELFTTCQKRLGSAARLGVAGILFDPGGETRADIGFNEDERFPMASVAKVPIAMLTASEIANDVGIIQFNDGSFAVLAVMTCHSTVPTPVRDDQIATVTRTVLRKWKTERLLEIS